LSTAAICPIIVGVKMAADLPSKSPGELSLERLRAAVVCQPLKVDLRIELANRLTASGRIDEARLTLLVAACLQFCAVQPDDAQARFQLGRVLNECGDDALAADAYRAVIALAPTMAEAYNNLGISLYNGLALDGAVGTQRRAVSLAPGNGTYHCNLAHSLLAKGALAEGFAAWEWRESIPVRNFSQPKWDGAPFSGQTILAHAEQGYGDTIQFCRYLPALAALGETVVVECRPPLIGLIERMGCVDRIIAWGDSLPSFDQHVPIPSLAHLLPESGTLAGAIPYLAADAERLARWRDAFAGAGRLKVGVVWAGNDVDPKRALSVEELAPLSAVPGVSLFGLQRGAPALTAAPFGNLGDAIEDFDDLAAAICALDMLISVDTAAAHLAGALGRPAWTLLHSAPDWRWLPDATRTAWYPGMRLYRQDRPGVWGPVIERVEKDLAALAG
jgi:tetratricopeptide (TPR) repeat protein